MFSFDNQIRVRYADTDQMQVVYHAKFIEYFESGRTEAIRHLGITYKEIEEWGLIMPVVKLTIEYARPGLYDDLLTIRTILKELPDSHSIDFHQEIYNEAEKLVCKGTITLFFVEKATRTKCTMPAPLREKLLPYFN
jgi:acyl-CoA thioester hydrolase